MRNPFLILGILYSGVAFGQSPDTLQRIDQLFSKWNNATPGVSVAIERNGKIIYHKAFGLANLEHNVPNTTSTIFEAGSVSKQFTAISILLLAQEGKLSLDDDVRKYIPELPTYDKTITIRQCMNHSSGLKDWGSIGSLTGFPRTTRVYTLDLALQIMYRQKSLNFSPGSEYSYSNGGYSLLVAIVERVSKMSLAEFTRTRLFEPAGMKNTQWRDNFREIVPGRATAYRRRAGVYEQDMPFEHIHGHGGLLTTVEDLIIWNRQLAHATIGGDGMIKARIERSKFTNGLTNDYAAGLFITVHEGEMEITHTGATAGYRAYLGWFPEEKLSIALLSNDGTFNPGGIGSQIADMFLGQIPETKAPSRTSITLADAALKKYEGVFRAIRIADAITLTVKDGKVFHEGRPMVIVHSDTLMDGRSYYIMKKNGQLFNKTPIDTFTYVRAKAPDNAEAYLKTLTGVYHSDEADATWRIEVKDGALWANQIPPGSWKLEPKFYDGFLVDGEDLYEFKRNKKGVVDRLEVSVPRAERVVFIKTASK